MGDHRLRASPSISTLMFASPERGSVPPELTGAAIVLVAAGTRRHAGARGDLQRRVAGAALHDRRRLAGSAPVPDGWLRDRSAGSAAGGVCPRTTRNCPVSKAMVPLAMIRLMLHRLAHPNRKRLPDPYLSKRAVRNSRRGKSYVSALWASLVRRRRSVRLRWNCSRTNPSANTRPTASFGRSFVMPVRLMLSTAAS